MKRFFLLAALSCSITMSAVDYYGLLFGTLEVSSENKDDIFGDGKASFDPSNNVLTLENGFSYSLSKGFVSVETELEQTFVIHLKGDAEIKAAVRSRRPLLIEADGAYTLSITSNISGSALHCPELTIDEQTTLNLLSRNSQEDMYALECLGTLTINSATLIAEVTTAQLAVKAQAMELHQCSLTKPKGGAINNTYGGICFGDGTPAKVVRISAWPQSLDEVQSDKVQCTKVIENGVLYLMYKETKYNVQGNKVEK